MYGRLRKFEEEAGEVLEIPPTMGTIDQINNPDAKTARKLAEEVTDTIIAGLGVLDTLGFDFERLFMEKLGIMYDKYNPSEIEHLVANGHSREDAVTIRKQQWQTPPYELLGRTGLEE